MGDVGYRGVSADQDGRYRNKEQLLLKKLASSGQFPRQFEEKVDMTKVNLEVIKPWITDKVSELLGFEDDVVVEYIHGMLEDPDNKQPDPKKMQLSLTGFLESNTPKFMAELWLLLLSAQKSLGGIPQEFVEKKKQEMREARERDANAIKGSGAIHDHRPEEMGGASGSSRPNGAAYGARGGGGRVRGRGRGDRFDDRGGRRGFVDKSGNRTERVNDQGWGARAGSRADEEHRSGPYLSRSAYEDDRYRESARGGYSNDRPVYSDDRQSRFQDRPYSPDRRNRSRTPDMRRHFKARTRSRSSSRSRSRSRSPGSATRRRQRSITPRNVSRRDRNRSRTYSRSVSPPRRRRNRSPTYSPSPSPSRKTRARSSTRSISPPPRRQHRNRHDSRSPVPPRKSRRRSLSRSYSPQPPRKRQSRSPSRSFSPSSRSPSPPRNRKT